MKKLLTLILAIGSINQVNAKIPSHYDVLEYIYLNGTNNSIMMEQLEGTYLGRCFKATSDEPIGMKLSTKKFTSTKVQSANSGPKFPQITSEILTWKMSMNLSTLKGVPVGAEVNDGATRAEMDSFWQEYGEGIDELMISNGVATNLYSDGDHESVKIGKDGLIYGSAQVQGYDLYCYFFKKLL